MFKDAALGELGGEWIPFEPKVGPISERERMLRVNADCRVSACSPEPLGQCVLGRLGYRDVGRTGNGRTSRCRAVFKDRPVQPLRQMREGPTGDRLGHRLLVFSSGQFFDPSCRSRMPAGSGIAEGRRLLWRGTTGVEGGAEGNLQRNVLQQVADL